MLHKIIITISLVTCFFFTTKTKNAEGLTTSDADWTGYRIAQKACESIWDDTAKSKTDAFREGLKRESSSTVIERFNMINNLINKYGENHPIVEAFFQGYLEIIYRNCRKEYENLPNGQ